MGWAIQGQKRQGHNIDWAEPNKCFPKYKKDPWGTGDDFRTRRKHYLVLNHLG